MAAAGRLPRTDGLHHRLLRAVIPCLVLIAGSVGTASACSVPVFRYALERWPADDYVAVVFHEGALSPGQAEWVKDLSRDGLAGRKYANLGVRTVDLKASPDDSLLRLWREHGASTSLPAIVLMQPAGLRMSKPVWSGPLNGDSVREVLDSPARQEVARRLLNGASVVWALIESGDSGLDAAAAGVLDARLKHLEASLELPELNPDDLSEAAAESKDLLKPAFSSIRLSRADPGEAVLVRMLLNIEEDLAASREPVVVPIFGQGRALYALVGRGIGPEMIDEAARFLTGACSCVVKEQNPGSDLLMAVDWAGLVEPFINTERELPPLPGIGGFAPGRPAAGDSVGQPSGEPVARQAAQGDTESEVSGGGGSPLFKGLLLASALGVGLLIGATLWLLRRGG